MEILKKMDYEEFKNPKKEDGLYKLDGFENLKDFLDYYMIIPKCKEFKKEETQFLNENRVYFKSKEEIKGQIFFTKKIKQKKFNLKEVQEIKTQHKQNNISYRKLAQIYKCSVATIYKILNDKYI